MIYHFRMYLLRILILHNLIPADEPTKLPELFRSIFPIPISLPTLLQKSLIAVLYPDVTVVGDSGTKVLTENRKPVL